MSYSVYVVELNPETFRPPKKFKKDNPHIWDSKGKTKRKDFKMFYVGQSAHSPKCRFDQHKQCHGEDIKFHCHCGMECTCCKNEHIIDKNRSNIWVREHGLKLRRDLYLKYNPMPTSAESVKAEKYLTAQLRKMGHASYCR